MNKNSLQPWSAKLHDKQNTDEEKVIPFEPSRDPPGTVSINTAIIPSQLAISSHPAIPLRVLAEEDYIDEMSAIIQRDFFPSSDETKSEKTSRKRRHTGDDWESDENFQTAESSAPSSLSLGQFLANYTSEDNASFMRLEAKLAREKQQKLSIQNRKQSNNNMNSGSLMIQQQKNSVMFFPDLPKPDIELINEETKKRKIDHKNTRFDHSLVNPIKLNINENHNTNESIHAPLVNGFGFIPSPAPTPIINVNNSNANISSVNYSSNRRGFHLPPTPKREEILLHLTQRKRQQRQNNFRSPFTPGLSPAANKILTTATRKNTSNFTNSFTPMPLLSPGTPR